MGFPGSLEVKASACNAGDPGSIPRLGRSPGEGNGNPLQYSCLENPMDGGAWWATVHGVAKSRTQLSDFTFTFHFNKLDIEGYFPRNRKKIIFKNYSFNIVNEVLKVLLLNSETNKDGSEDFSKIRKARKRREKI